MSDPANALANSVHPYEWEPVWAGPPFLVPDRPLGRWLIRVELQTNEHKPCNPFGPGNPDLDHLLRSTWADPNGWRHIKGACTSLIAASDRFDARAAMLRLRHELCTMYSNNVFPVQVAAPIRLVGANRDTLTGILVHAAADAWMSLFVLSPEAMEHLGTSQQDDVARLVLYGAGSYAHVHDRLQHRWSRARETRPGSRSQLLQHLRKAEGKVGQRIEPRDTDRWLRLRPHGTVATHILMTLDDASEAMSSVASGCSSLVELTDGLIASHVTVKLFAAGTPQVLRACLPHIDLVWPDAMLRHMLNDRVAAVSRVAYPREFCDLFGVPPLEEATTRLVTSARGSLGRMCDLGDRIIRIHVQRRARQDSLSMADVDAVLPAP